MPNQPKREYPNSGRLFYNEPESHRHPAWTGDLTLEKSLLEDMIKSGNFKLRLAGWEKKNDRGDWLSLTASASQPKPAQASMINKRTPPHPQSMRDDDSPFD